MVVTATPTVAATSNRRPAAGYSLNNPADIGILLEAEFSSRFHDTFFRVKAGVLDIRRGEDIEPMLSDVLVDAPPPGMEYGVVLLRFEVLESSAGKGLFVKPEWWFEVVSYNRGYDALGKTHRDASRYGFYPWIWAPVVYPGGAHEGWFVVLLEEGVPAPVLKFKTITSVGTGEWDNAESPLWFKLYRD